MIDAEGHGLLRARCTALGDVLREAIDAPLPRLSPRALDARRWVVTATGASEAAARLFAWALRRRALVAAEFVPLSAFARAAPRGDALAVFSQALSPNARMAISSACSFPEALVVTAAVDEPSLAGLTVCATPPACEEGLLVRVQGPSAQCVAALRLADTFEDRGGTGPLLPTDVATAIPGAVQSCFNTTLQEAQALRPNVPLAFVTDPEGADTAHGLRWKWLEAIGTCDPSCWDVLQFAHGPWQHVVGREYTLVCLERDEVSRALNDRLASMLDPALHTLIRLRASLPGAAAIFEHEAGVNALVCAALEGHRRDLRRWPGFGTDAPLYGIGRDTD